MPQPFGQFPRSLRQHARWLHVGGIPIVFMHPDARAGDREDVAVPTHAPARPTLLWLHGRTVDKELDPGRYQRLLAAGIAVVAMDLPGHGERPEQALQLPASLATLIDRSRPDIDALAAWMQDQPGIDADRLSIGGMSAGGMAAACRLCDAHPFQGLLLESTTGDLLALPDAAGRGAARLAALNPIDRIASWRDIPVLALHSELDRMVPVASQRRFIQALQRRSAHPERITLKTWPTTGAPEEHAGFGRCAAEAKQLGTAFVQRASGLLPW